MYVSMSLTDLFVNVLSRVSHITQEMSGKDCQNTEGAIHFSEYINNVEIITSLITYCLECSGLTGYFWVNGAAETDASAQGKSSSSGTYRVLAAPSQLLIPQP